MIYIAAGLAALFTFGCVVMPVYAAIWLWNDRERGPAIVCMTIVWPITIVIGALPWLAYADSQSPVLATLHKNEWLCAASHSVTTTTYVKSSNVLVPMTTTHQVCDQYARKP